VFIGTPHRFESQDDAEDQILKLVLLPGPEIKKGALTKAKYLAEQIDETNKRFLSTKLLDRACIFNIISQSVINSLLYKAADDLAESSDDYEYDPTDPGFIKTVTPFRRNSHFIGHSFEASGRVRRDLISHLDLVRDEGSEELDTFQLEMTGFSKPCPLQRLYGNGVS
jgi:hypothetical protein